SMSGICEACRGSPRRCRASRQVQPSLSIRRLRTGITSQAQTITFTCSNPHMNNELDIAIVGMSCRLPGAQHLDEFWQNLAGAVESIERFSDQEILESGVPASFLTNPNYVKASPILVGPGFF